MDDKKLHDLAVAYAQTKLATMQNNNEYDLDSTSEEIKAFLKSYHFALTHIPEENKEISLDELC